MAKRLTTILLSVLLIFSLSFSLASCKKESIVLDGTYVYMLGGEIPTFSYVFENYGVTMYVAGEFQASGTYYIENGNIYLNFEVSTKVGKYNQKKDEITMLTSDYGEIILSKVQ